LGRLWSRATSATPYTDAPRGGRIQTTSSLIAGVMPPDRYPEFSEFSRQVEAAEQGRLEVQLNPI